MGVYVVGTGRDAGVVVRCDPELGESGLVDRHVVEDVVRVLARVAEAQRDARDRVVRGIRDGAEVVESAVDVPGDVRPVVDDDEVLVARRQRARGRRN